MRAVPRAPARWLGVLTLLASLAGSTHPAAAAPPTCGDTPAAAQLRQVLRQSPLPDGYRLAEWGCTQAEGGAYWLALAPPGEGDAVYVVLADPDRVEHAYAKPGPFAVFYREPAPRGAPLDALMSAVVAAAERIDSPASQPPPFPVRSASPGGQSTAAPFPAEQHDPGMLVWILCLLVLAPLAFAWPLSPHARLLGAAFTATALLILGTRYASWESPDWAWLWLWVLSAAGLVAFSLRGQHPRRLLIAAAILALALVIRGLVPGGPINQQTELMGPADALSPAWNHRVVGLAALYRGLDDALGLSANAVLAIQRVLGALSVALLYLAVRSGWSDNGERPAWTPAGALLFGVLLAVEPLQARFAASDGTMVLALFCFSLGAWLYTMADRWGRWGAAAFFIACAMPGLLRPELLLGPLLYPALFGQWFGVRDSYTWSGPASVNLVLLAALVPGIGLGLHRASDMVAGSGELAGNLQAFLEALPAHLDPSLPAEVAGLQPSPRVFPQEVLYLALAAVVVGALLRRPRPAVVLLACLAAFGLRVASGFPNVPLAEDFADARYDLLTMVGLLLLAAEGAVLLVLAGRRLVRRHSDACRYAGGLVLLAGALALAHAASGEYRPPLTLRMSYQHEHELLEEALDGAAPGCGVAAVAVAPSAPQPLFSENVLALPSPLLSFDDRDRRWLVLGGKGLPNELCERPCWYYFHGAACERAEALADDPAVSAADLPHFRDAAELCRSLREAGRPLLERAVPAVFLRGVAWEGTTRRPELKLGFYRLDSARLSRACGD